MSKRKTINFHTSWFNLNQDDFDMQVNSVVKILEDSSLSFRSLKLSMPYSYVDAYRLIQNSLTPNFKNKTIREQIVDAYKDFKSIQKIFIKEYQNFTEVKVVLEMKTYDYNLMNDIFRIAEFPLKELNSHMLINVDYIPSIAEEGNLVDPFIYELIYNRDLLNFNTLNNPIYAGNSTDYIGYQTI